MASVKPNITIHEYQNFVLEIYGLSNDRYFGTRDMLINIERFTMRGIKGIRKKDPEKTKLNLLIAESWFMSLMNKLHIDIEEEIWKRFPYVCSYCASCPCVCKEKKIQTRHKPVIDETKHPKTFADVQQMFEEIYPPQTRSIEDAGIHVAEEMGELSEALLKYRGSRKDDDFRSVIVEAADFFSCVMGVFNSLHIVAAKELSQIFDHNCHACKKVPCECSFEYILNFKS